MEARFSGIPVSAGVAIGRVFRASESAPQITRHKIAAADSAGEGARLDAAVAQSRKQLTKLRSRLAVLPEESQEEKEEQQFLSGQPQPKEKSKAKQH